MTMPAKTSSSHLQVTRHPTLSISLPWFPLLSIKKKSKRPLIQHSIKKPWLCTEGGALASPSECAKGSLGGSGDTQEKPLCLLSRNEGLLGRSPRKALTLLKSVLGRL